MPVGTMFVRGIEGMIPEHVLRLLRQKPPRYLIDVFVVSKREMDLIEPAVRFVDAIIGLVFGNRAIGIGGKEFRKNDLLRESASDRERITHYGPLGLPVETEHFAEIVHKTGQNEPARMTILANRFGGLQEMFDLGQIGVGIAVVHQRIQVLRHFPDTFLAPRQAAVFGLFSQHEIKSLASVVLTVELRHGGIGFRLVVAKLFFRFALTIAGGDKIVPIVQFLQRRVLGSIFHNDTLIMNLRGSPDNPDFFLPSSAPPARLLKMSAV